MIEHGQQPGDESDVEEMNSILRNCPPEDRAYFEKLKAAIEAGPPTISVPLNPGQFEAAIYALRMEAHNQDPESYPACEYPSYPGYDPWPSDMAATADYLARKLIEAVRGEVS